MTMRMMIVRAAFFAAMAAGLASPVAGNAADGAGSRFQSIAQQLANDESCWSCKIYGEVFTGLRKVVNSAYGFFTNDQKIGEGPDCKVSPDSLGIKDDGVGSGSSSLRDISGGGAGFNTPSSSGAVTASCSGQGGGGAGGILALGVTILAIAVMIKVLPIAIGTQDPRQVASGLRMFLLRIAVVFTIFLSASSASLLSNDGFLSVFIVDGPLAVGTEIGVKLANASATAMNTQGARIEESGDGSGSLGDAHVKAAKAMLLKMHQLGVAGVITGVWIMLEGATNLQGAHWMTILGTVAAGFALTGVFFMFTITFALRYLDALIRSMLIFALMPIFAFLWIFDSTRDIAIRALKAGLALGAVFAVSGVVFSVAIFIMQLGFQKAFSATDGTGMTTQTLQTTLNTIAGGAYNFLGGTNGAATSINWLSFFYLLGSASMAIACAKMAFDVAGSLFSIGRTETGMGRELEGEVSGAAGAVMSKVPFVGGRR